MKEEEEGKRGREERKDHGQKQQQWESERKVDYKAVIYLLVSNKSVAFIISVWFCDLKSLYSLFLFFFFCCCEHSFLHNDCIIDWHKKKWLPPQFCGRSSQSSYSKQSSATLWSTRKSMRPRVSPLISIFSIFAFTCKQRNGAKPSCHCRLHSG